ncbi:MAG: PF20097 family protein [Erysipelotrichaceae bacterium]|nr:PF20097 family protein [Erysipelotrichaceae bacterium]
MICPYCGKEMTQTFIQSSYPIYLNKNKARFFPSGDLSSRTLSSFSITKSPFVKSYYCEDCAKIIIDLKEKKDHETGIRKRSHKR